jgi:hypothetical protein
MPTEYTAEKFDNHNLGYFIGGIDGEVIIEKEADAKMIAEALNLARRLRSIKRKLKTLQGEVSFILESEEPIA